MKSNNDTTSKNEQQKRHQLSLDLKILTSLKSKPFYNQPPVKQTKKKTHDIFKNYQTQLSLFQHQTSQPVNQTNLSFLQQEPFFYDNPNNNTSLCVNKQITLSSYKHDFPNNNTTNHLNKMTTDSFYQNFFHYKKLTNQSFMFDNNNNNNNITTDLFWHNNTTTNNNIHNTKNTNTNFKLTNPFGTNLMFQRDTKSLMKITKNTLTNSTINLLDNRDMVYSSTKNGFKPLAMQTQNIPHVQKKDVQENQIGNKKNKQNEGKKTFLGNKRFYIENRPKRKRYYRKKTKIQTYEFSCVHPNCGVQYKTNKQRIAHHNKMNQECRSDLVGLIYLIKETKVLLMMNNLHMLNSNEENINKIKIKYEKCMQNSSLQDHVQFVTGKNFEEIINDIQIFL